MGDSNSTILDPWPPLAPGLLLVMPSKAFGSDYTALYFLFMEVPILVLSLLVLGICFVAPKVGRVLVAILFAGSLFILGWASEVGYMESAGGLLVISIVIDLFGIVVSAKRIKDARNAPTGEST